MAADIGTNPARSFFNITPSDTVALPQFTRGLQVGTAGDIKVLGVGDTSPTVLSGVTAGDHPYAVQRVYSTGTTASGISGLA